MYILDQNLYFPPVTRADRHGVLALGGDLSTERLLLAYRSGIFPWFNDDEPIIWWAPPQRMVLFPNELKVSKSMRNVLNRGLYEVTFNQAFAQVIRHCSAIPRPGQDGSWITDDMIAAYIRLHELGWAKSVEVWQDGQLVGGLYGVDLGHVFCGESMFSLQPNASKVAFITWVRHLQTLNYRLIDCQVYNEHLASLGCREIPRIQFMDWLRQ